MSKTKSVKKYIRCWKSEFWHSVSWVLCWRGNSFSAGFLLNLWNLVRDCAAFFHLVSYPLLESVCLSWLGLHLSWLVCFACIFRRNLIFLAASIYGCTQMGELYLFPEPQPRGQFEGEVKIPFIFLYLNEKHGSGNMYPFYLPKRDILEYNPF